MHKSLYIILLGMVISSCSTQKSVQRKAVQPKSPLSATPKPAPQQAVKPTITKDHGAEFFKINIADPNKNDNTISYGSIVSANPQHYKVVKTYFPAVGQNFRQRFIVLHYTALNNDKSAMVLSQQAVSAHYLVNNLPDNEIYQLVDENKRAYHAGVSSWRGFSQLNDTSIGIEIVNEASDRPGGGHDFVSFPDYQIAKVAALVKDIAVRYQIPPTNIVAHADIAPTRKEDPGPLFPWKRLYTDYQIGMWYDEAVKQDFLSQINSETFYAQASSAPFIFKYQAMLKDFGYPIEPSGLADNGSKQTVMALQYHYRPEKYDGVMDMETYAILQALQKKYPR